MTAALPERRHDRLLSRVRGLQRSIATIHRAALDDLVGHIAASIAGSGGQTVVGTEIIRTRLLAARRQTHALMRQSFRELVEEGHRAGIAVADVGLRRRGRKQEDIQRPRAGVFQSEPSDGFLPLIQGTVADIERGVGRFVQPLDPVDVARAAGTAIGQAATAVADRAKDALTGLTRMPERAVDAILDSRNAWGRTWEQQFSTSSERTARGLTLGIVLAHGLATEEETIASIRGRIQPFVEEASNAMQLVGQAEGMRLGQRGQRWVYDRIEMAGDLLTGYVLHCACIPTSAPDHVARHLKFYEAIEPGVYVAADGEMMPEPPYGHPNCLCWCVPEFL